MQASVDVTQLPCVVPLQSRLPATLPPPPPLTPPPPALPAAAPCAAMAATQVDTTLNPRVASLKPSKTMALTDLATKLKEEGADIIGLAAGEPDVRRTAERPWLLKRQRLLAFGLLLRCGSVQRHVGSQRRHGVQCSSGCRRLPAALFVPCSPSVLP